ncbi:YeeE/YedE family protein [Schleiferiaceae bacterium]|nr:YeeE/YedE family protein [Schleiferiaceae bacterium]
MKFFKYLVAGTIFGIVMAQSEALSWYRIQEMFRFQSFHMYGIIGMAVCLGVLGVFLIKKFQLKDIQGNPIEFAPKEPQMIKSLLGGTIFGLGWALSGACPGPIVVNIGYGISSMSIVLLFAVFGTYCYGILRDKLPH